MTHRATIVPYELINHALICPLRASVCGECGLLREWLDAAALSPAQAVAGEPSSKIPVDSSQYWQDPKTGTVHNWCFLCGYVKWHKVSCAFAIGEAAAPAAAPETSELEKLRSAVKRVYYAGHWMCDRPVDAFALWTELRDAAGFDKGHAPKPASGDCNGLICQAFKDDGIICANDECDRDSGVRPAAQAVAGEREWVCPYCFRGDNLSSTHGPDICVRREAAAPAAAPDYQFVLRCVTCSCVKGPREEVKVCTFDCCCHDNNEVQL